jgi:anti-sigma B factor antagonist
VSLFYVIDEPVQGSEEGLVLLLAGGELDYAAAPQLRERIAEHVGVTPCHLVLDLSQATFIDSTAIGVIIGALATLQESGDGSLTIVCEQENTRVMRIFDIAGVSSLLEVHHTREDAFSALAATG